MGVVVARDLGANAGAVPPSAALLDDGVMMRIPVDVAGKTLYFLLDSGFTTSAVDSRYASLLGEAITTNHAESPLGNDKTLPVFKCPPMSVSGKRLALEQITCLDLEMARLISGQPCDGILGMDFFEKNIVAIDFDNDTFSLEAAVPEAVKQASTAIPLRREEHYYALDVMADHRQPLSLMVDTGDSSSVSLNEADWQQVFGNDQTNTITATVADAANRIAQSKIGILAELEVKNLGYTNLHATFIQNPATPSHLGLGFFKRHKVTFDFADQSLYLEPGRRYAMPDREDMSGLHLLREDGLTAVHSVDQGSPAYVGGIRPGDVIEIVNGQNSASLSMRAIRRILRSDDGEKVVLQVKRGADEFGVNLSLKKAI